MAPVLTSVNILPLPNVKSEKGEADKPAIEYDYSLLRRLIKNSSSTFSCAGSIPVTTNTTYKYYGRVPTKSQPFSIFWTSKDSVSQKLVLPIGEKDDSSGTGALQQLINDCAPATFGKNNEDVLDSTYRKAGKLEPAYFATSFHPADLDILDEIERKLLPSFNIYSGPDGFFRKHIDTPRSANQIGSLVVCLPSRFTGGNLYVRHNKQVHDLDWSPVSSSTVQWAAFYSDCEHEIGPVTGGERITLTYNLYAADAGIGRIGYDLTLRPRVEPLEMALMKMLDSTEFMLQGGIIGVFCAYAYPTASPVASYSIDRVLKDSDYLLYSAFKSFGLETTALSVSSTGAWYDYIVQRAHVMNIPTQIENDIEAKVVASEAWPSVTLPGVTWANEQNRDEIALMHLPRGTGAAAAAAGKGGPRPVAFGKEPPSPPYGNDSPDDISPGKTDKSAVLQYADGAIFVFIPPWGQRL
ncbi:hypothetical protein AbraIFM66951_004797 [Aspergillus brasiliensis]|uniref:Fe2OG dioxygenase domain-containing protein n=1 Tax=Aspergillus brasiliensis TaxID=319629 RepID=A0A9W5Z292_9EURO|nr:hypothetical protein AbraCBS73388_003993 [Aspergillus brasiliensis]GKZ50985.1 hypothetical protein AbraIFM66951_004797 [Aspergillus brasiliensis]